MKPITIGVGNCASVSTGKARAIQTFQRALETPGVDVWALVECADFAAQAYAPRGWATLQHGTEDHDPARMGNVLAWTGPNVLLEEATFRLGSARTGEGGGIRDRFILGGRFTVSHGQEENWNRLLECGHAPPGRSPRARARFMRALLATGGLKAGDFNLLERAVARLTRRKVRGVGVMHLVIPRDMKVLAVREVRHGSDHLGYAVTVVPKVRRRKRRRK